MDQVGPALDHRGIDACADVGVRRVEGLLGTFVGDDDEQQHEADQHKQQSSRNFQKQTHDDPPGDFNEFATCSASNT